MNHRRKVQVRNTWWPVGATSTAHQYAVDSINEEKALLRLGVLEEAIVLKQCGRELDPEVVAQVLNAEVEGRRS